jgi:hypothetical protein
MTTAWRRWAQGGDDGDDGGVHDGEETGEHEAAHAADRWALFLEDDVDWHHELKGRPEAIADALAQGLPLAQEDGIAVLGWCEPGFNKAGADWWWSDAVAVRRGNGMCAHAVALTRWRAATLETELELFRTGEADKDVHIDVLLHRWIHKGEGSRFSSWGGVYLLGSNLTVLSASPNATGSPAAMVGMLYQDRARHASHTEAPIRGY